MCSYSKHVGNINFHGVLIVLHFVLEHILNTWRSGIRYERQPTKYSFCKFLKVLLIFKSLEKDNMHRIIMEI